jgi:hypothetical protein
MILSVVAILALPAVAYAQGIVGGTQQGASQGASQGARAGSKAAGLICGAVGTFVGGTAGAVTGGVQRARHTPETKQAEKEEKRELISEFPACGR